MSRGHGKVQRQVLEAARGAVEDGMPRWVSVDEVLSGSGADHEASRSTLTRSERESIRRAMRTLARDGHVALGDVWRGQPTRRHVAVRVPPTAHQRAHERAHEAQERADELALIARVISHRKDAYDAAIEAQHEADRLYVEAHDHS